MYHRIFVPLDGSALAEKALPYANKLAIQLKATLVLLRVVKTHPVEVDSVPSTAFEAENRHLHEGELTTGNSNPGVIVSDFIPFPPTYEDITFTADSERIEAEDYLERVKERLVSGATLTPLKADQIETQVVAERSPKELPAILMEEGADLVVMTTHSRSGLSLLLTGSVAANLIHHSSLPVILVKPGEGDNQGLDGPEAERQTVNSSSNPIVVSLDGTARSETVLDTAANLAQVLGVKIHLYQLVQVAIPGLVGGEEGFIYLPDYDDQTKDLQREAETYLNRIQTRLRGRNVEAITEVQIGEPTLTLGFNGEPISRIVNYAREVKAQLVAMTTHGRDSFGQLILGSIAEEVVRQSNLPVLLMRNDSLSGHQVK